MTKRRWKQPDKRMEAAIRMRAAGWSLRKIAGHLGVSEGTIRNDLGRWEQQNVDELLRNLDAQSGPSGDGNYAANYAPEESP